MTIESINQIRTGLSFDGAVVPVGKMAKLEHKIYFEYDASFIDQGLEISPIKCPTRPGVQTFDPSLFEGLPGVFNDSVSDGWGRLLLDRKIRLGGILPEQISPLDRLAHVGQTGMGALVYEFSGTTQGIDPKRINLDLLAAGAVQILEGEATDVLYELLLLNGSSGGARPKAMIGVDQNKERIVHGTHQLPDDFEPWLVKFPNINDGLDAGAIEYVYALMAKEAGLTDGESLFIPRSKRRQDYFATKRFDRNSGKRLHSHTACGLLHSDFRTPSLDYEDLIALTMILTKDIREAEKMFRLAVFNVLAHNRDDHSKNFSFLMDQTGEWKLSPAYDLTFSSGPRGEQSTMVMGQGKSPAVADLVKLGLEAKLPLRKINDIIEQTKAALDNWSSFSKQHGVCANSIDLVAGKIRAVGD